MIYDISHVNIRKLGDEKKNGLKILHVTKDLTGPTFA